jgi:hypothetical protein
MLVTLLRAEPERMRCRKVVASPSISTEAPHRVMGAILVRRFIKLTIWSMCRVGRFEGFQHADKCMSAEFQYIGKLGHIAAECAVPTIALPSRAHWRSHFWVQLVCVGRMTAFVGRCWALLERMQQFMRCQSIQYALPNRPTAKPIRSGAVQDGRYGAFRLHARWSVSGGSSNPACGGSAIYRLYTPCARKGCGIFDRYAQSAEYRK